MFKKLHLIGLFPVAVCFVFVCVNTMINKAYAQNNDNYAVLSMQNLPEQAWIQNKGAELLRMLALENSAERFGRLRYLINSSFDVGYIARKVIGRKWNTLDTDTQNRFISVFENYLLYSYAAAPMNTNAVSIAVNKITQISANNGNPISKVFVTVTLPWTNPADNLPQTVTANFTVRQDGADDFKILDATITGASIVTFIKNTFNAKMQEGYNNIYVVLQNLEQTVNNIQYQNSVGDSAQSDNVRSLLTLE